jgi:PAS domain S-box-containing protein
MHTYFKKNIKFNEKKQIQYVIISFLLIVIISLGTNLIPPLFNLSVVPMASLSLALFSLIIVYSMIKYKLMGLTTAETADVVVDTMADSLLVIDENKNIVNVNKSTLDLLGYSENKLMTSPLGKILNLHDFESQIYPQVVSDGKIENVETAFLTKDGKSVPMYISASAIYDSTRELQGIVFVGRDLRDTKKLIDDLEKAKNRLEEKVDERTNELLNINKELQIEIKERKNVEEQIKSSLKEKEILLKEIHHRVKNNLQIISSLLNLQAADLKDSKILEQFEEIQKRIKSMSLIHEQLYKSKDLTRIDFDKYIYDLTANLSYSYGSKLDHISFKTKVKSIFLNIDQAIPCGLIINELMSNSIKHGFPRGKKGEILVDFHLDEDNNYTLIVSDNRLGWREGLDFQSTESVGLKLVNLLTKQLKGTIKLDRNHGTSFKIIFPIFKNKDKRIGK